MLGTNVCFSHNGLKWVLVNTEFQVYQYYKHYLSPLAYQISILPKDRRETSALLVKHSTSNSAIQ
jgi:hypothetical protein